MTTTESPVLSHGKVVVVLDRAEFEALDWAATTTLTNRHPSAFQQKVDTATSWLDRVRTVFAGGSGS